MAIPNTTPTPNELFNGEMPKMSDTDLRIVLVVTRATLGWEIDNETGMRKQEDWISYYQLKKKTGRGYTSIAKSIDRCISMGWIETRDEKGNLLDTKNKRIGKKIFYRLGSIFLDKIKEETTSSECGEVEATSSECEITECEISECEAYKRNTITKETLNKTDDLFNQFWKEYPKKVGKVVAQRSFNKLKVSDSLLKEILNGLRAYKETEQWQKDRGKYIPNPATFLNQRRWEDSLEEDGGEVIIPDYAKDYNYKN